MRKARRRVRWLAAVLIIALALPALTACGKRGQPEPPPGQKSTYPGTYPNPNSDE
jgi:predicted small lipoprotein YifL